MRRTAHTSLVTLAALSTVILASANARADDACSKARGYAEKIWAEYKTHAASEGCASPVTGPGRFRACFIKPGRAQAIGNKMLGWYNNMVNNSWATLGPRTLTATPAEGTIKLGAGRLFISSIPEHTGQYDLQIRKRGGKAAAQISLCKITDDGTFHQAGALSIPNGDDNVGRTFTLRATQPMEGGLVAAWVDTQSANDFEYAISGQAQPAKDDIGPVTGFADVHVHQVSSLGFGGSFYWSGPDHAGELALPIPAGACTAADHALPNVSIESMNIDVRHGTATSHGPLDTAHSNTLLAWVKAAHANGLNLMVASPVSAQIICEAMKIAHPNATRSCDDMDNVDAQIDAIFKIAAEQSDWYEVAMDPWHARQIIHAGKLAVVISPETSNLFPRSKGDAVTQLHQWYAKGVRSLQLAHETDSWLAGAAHHDGGLFPVMSWLKNPIPLQGAGLDANGWNKRGLTADGERVLQEVVALHMPLDINHLSQVAKDRVYELVSTKYDYFPLYASHTRFAGPWDRARREGNPTTILDYETQKAQIEFVTDDKTARNIMRTGGIFGLRPGPNKIPQIRNTAWVPANKQLPVPAACAGSTESFAQLVLYGKHALGASMAFGSDTSGFIALALAPSACRKQKPEALKRLGADRYWERGFVQLDFEKDILEDARSLGVDTSSIESSAEAYLKMWERAYARSGPVALP